MVTKAESKVLVMEVRRMSDKGSGQYDVSAIRNDIVPVCERQPEIAAVFLFGSYGTCYETEFSDIDLGVLFFHDGVPDLKGELKLTNLLCRASGRDNIDMVVLNKAPLPLRYRIIADGQLLFDRNHVYTSDFLAITYKLFLDYNIDYQKFMDEYRHSLQEAYGSNG